MPSVRFIPRGAEYRYYYKALERYFIGNQIKGLSVAVLVQCVLLLKQGSCPSSGCRRKLLCPFGSALPDVFVWRHDQNICWNVYVTKCMQSIDDDLFFKMFRFKESIFIKCWLLTPEQKSLLLAVQSLHTSWNMSIKHVGNEQICENSKKVRKAVAQTNMWSETEHVLKSPKLCS